MRILVLAVAVLAALVPFVPLVILAATFMFAVPVTVRPLRRIETRRAVQPVALLALVPFRAPPAFV